MEEIKISPGHTITLVNLPINPGPQHAPTFCPSFLLTSSRLPLHLTFPCTSLSPAPHPPLHVPLDTQCLPSLTSSHPGPAWVLKQRSLHLSTYHKPWLGPTKSPAQQSSGGHLAATANKGYHPRQRRREAYGGGAGGKDLPKEVTSGLRRLERLRSRMTV